MSLVHIVVLVSCGVKETYSQRRHFCVNVASCSHAVSYLMSIFMSNNLAVFFFAVREPALKSLSSRFVKIEIEYFPIQSFLYYVRFQY